MRSKEELLEKYKYKVCNKCGLKLPIDKYSIIFYKSCGYRIHHICKKCDVERMKEYYKIKKSKGLKKCSKCNKWKAIVMFGKAKMPYSKDGKSVICKECDEERKLKICIICKKEKQLKEFYKINNNGEIHYKNICKDCTNEEIRKKRNDRHSVYDLLKKEGIYNAK